MMSHKGHGGAVLERVLQPAEGPGALVELEGLSVGERIKALRDARSWSAQKLADESALAGAPSLTRSALAKVENGLRRLRTEEAVTLTQVLGVPLGDLLSVEGSGPDHIPGSTDRLDARASGATQEPPAAADSDLVRRAELDWLINDLKSVGGPHFWLLTAPPGMGKTTLLTQLDREFTAAPGWQTKLVDLRTQPPEVRQDAAALLARLFPLDASEPDEAATHRAIARRLSRAGQRVVCLLDSAEELSPRTTRLLRSSLSEVHRLVEQTGNPDVRLAFVVASRLDAGWLGVTSTPRLSVLRVPGFGVDVLEERLRGWAAQAGRSPAARFSHIAVLVHRATAGLPALLDPVLQWIQTEEWLDLHRLDSHEVFESLAGPFIGERLLAPDSLFPRAKVPPERRRSVLQDAVRYLVRYRFFTLSHVRRHVDADAGFRRSLERAEWTVEDLWSALGGSSLLARPMDEPWQEFHPAIRRLLFRYFHSSAGEGAAAHREAASFMAVWATSQSGTDQVMGLVEGLWHAAAALCLEGEQPSQVREKLRTNAAEFAGVLKPSTTYSVYELREYAASRIAADVELQETIEPVDGLADELIEIVKAQE